MKIDSGRRAYIFYVLFTLAHYFLYSLLLGTGSNIKSQIAYFFSAQSIIVWASGLIICFMLIRNLPWGWLAAIILQAWNMFFVMRNGDAVSYGSVLALLRAVSYGYSTLIIIMSIISAVSLFIMIFCILSFVGEIRHSRNKPGFSAGMLFIIVTSANFLNLAPIIEEFSFYVLFREILIAAAYIIAGSFFLKWDHKGREGKLY